MVVADTIMIVEAMAGVVHLHSGKIQFCFFSVYYATINFDDRKRVRESEKRVTNTHKHSRCCIN